MRVEDQTTHEIKLSPFGSNEPFALNNPSDNQGDTASAIAAINYATMMRTQFSTNLRVLNGS